MTKIRVAFLAMFLVFLATGICTAQEEDVAPKSVRGTIKEIARDGSYILVDDSKIITSEDFLTDSYLEVGDKVEITVEDTAQGLKALDYDYLFGDDESIYVVEEDLSSDEQNPVGEHEEELDEEDFSY